MVQKAQLLRKTLQAAAAARDGLHTSVGAGLELNLNPSFDFNNNLTPGANGQAAGMPRGPLYWSNLNAHGLGHLANAQVPPALNHYLQHPLALPRTPIPPPIPPSFPRTLPLGTLPPKPTWLGTRVSSPLTPPLPPPPGVASTSQPAPPPHPAPAVQGIDAATAESLLASLLGQPQLAAAAHASTSAPSLPPPASAPEQTSHTLAEALGQGSLPATHTADGLGSHFEQQQQHAHHQEHPHMQHQQHQLSHQPAGEHAAAHMQAPHSSAMNTAASSAAAAAAERHSRMLHSRQQLHKPSPLPHSQPPAKHPRTRGSGMSVALNKSIMNATCVGELLALVRARGSSFDFFNISSAVSRAPKLVEAEHAASARAHGPHHSHHSSSAAAEHSSSSGPTAAATADHLGSTGEGQSEGSGACAHNSGFSSSNSAPLSGRARALADCLYNLSLQHLHTFDARGLANTAWAFAKMRYVPDSCLPAALSAQAAAHIDEFAAQNLSNLAWAMVYMHHRDPFLLGLMSDRVLLLREQFKPQEVANIMWAFASLEHHDTSTLAGLCERVGQLGPRVFKEQELSNILWSLGRAHHQAGPLLDELLDETLHKLDHFQPQGVSNIVWALGQLNHGSPALLSAISQRYSHPGALRAFDSQGLCNLAWGSAMLGHHDPVFMTALADEALRRACTCGLGPGTHTKEHHADAASAGIHAAGHGSSSLCLTTVLWAAAALGDRTAASRLLQAVSDEARAHPPSRTSSNGSAPTNTPNKSSNIFSWEPTSLAQAAWGCVRIMQMAREDVNIVQEKQQEMEECLDTLAAAVAARVERFSGQPLVLALSAFGSSGSAHEPLVEHLTKRVERAAPMMSEQQCKACLEALHNVHTPASSAAADALHKRSAALAAAAAAAADARAAAAPATSAHASSMGTRHNAAQRGHAAALTAGPRTHAKGAPRRGHSWKNMGGAAGAPQGVSGTPVSWDAQHASLPLPVDGTNWQDVLRAAGMADAANGAGNGAGNGWLGVGNEWVEAAAEALRRSAAGQPNAFMQGGVPPANPLAVAQAAAAAAAAATQAALRAGGGAHVDVGQQEQMREHVWASAWPRGLFEDVGEIEGSEKRHMHEARGEESGTQQGQQADIWAPGSAFPPTVHHTHTHSSDNLPSPSSANSGNTAGLFPTSSPFSEALMNALLSGEAACQSLPGSAALAGPHHLRARLQGLEGLGLDALGLSGFGGMSGGMSGGMVDGMAGHEVGLGGFGMTSDMGTSMAGNMGGDAQGAWAAANAGMNSGVGGGMGGVDGLGGAGFSTGFGAGSGANPAGGAGSGLGSIDALSQWLAQAGGGGGGGGVFQEDPPVIDSWGLGFGGSLDTSSCSTHSSGSAHGDVGAGAGFGQGAGFGGQPEGAGGAPAASAGWSSHWFPQMFSGGGDAGATAGCMPVGGPLDSSRCCPGPVDRSLSLGSSGSGGSGSGLLPRGLLEPQGSGESAWGAGFHAGQEWALSAL